MNNIGIGIQFAAATHVVYQRALECGIGVKYTRTFFKLVIVNDQRLRVQETCQAACYSLNKHCERNNEKCNTGHLDVRQ
jgi:hypothetical protein